MTTELIVGRTYEAVGPAHGSKLGPPVRVKIIEELPHGWRTEGLRQAATVIRRECAGNYREVSS